MIKTNLRSKSAVMKVYDKESPVYYPKRFASAGGRYIDFIEKELLVRYGKGPSLFEIGTATGRFVGFVEETGWDYTGIDISAKMLRLSRDNGCKLLQGDAEEIPLRSTIFDTVICLHTFHFLPDPLACIRESRRILKIGGRLILIFETDNWLRRMTLKTGMFESDQYYFTTQEVTSMIQNCGLTPIAQGPVMKFPIEAYRKLPFTKGLKQLDSSSHWPSWFATLGFAIGRKDAPEPSRPA
jgi:ubiquinone/menaquinone biosynthesis C-methylase UbiE